MEPKKEKIFPSKSNKIAAGLDLFPPILIARIQVPVIFFINNFHYVQYQHMLLGIIQWFIYIPNLVLKIGPLFFFF